MTRDKLIMHLEMALMMANGAESSIAIVSKESVEDMLDILNKQEPKLVAHNYSPVCPTCGEAIADGEGVKFCSYCGQEVKWNNG